MSTVSRVSKKHRGRAGFCIFSMFCFLFVWEIALGGRGLQVLQLFYFCFSVCLGNCLGRAGFCNFCNFCIFVFRFVCEIVVGGRDFATFEMLNMHRKCSSSHSSLRGITHPVQSHFLLRSASAHSNSVLTFPHNINRHTCHWF